MLRVRLDKHVNVSKYSLTQETVTCPNLLPKNLK